MKKSLLTVCSVLAFAAVLPSSAHAQSMDYGSLQELFGEPVTTSATGTPLRVSESPANMTIVTADEIRQSGSRNIPQILSRVPGLDIMHEGLNVFDVGVRGYAQPYQPRLLVLIDGRQVFWDDYSRTLWDNIPVNIDDIRQIEVVKGAASALFGSNAAGGVINIVTYSPLYDNNNVANVTVGTQSEITGDATFTVNNGKLGTKTSFGGLDAKEFDTYRYPAEIAGNPVQDPTHRYFTNSTIWQATPQLQFNSEITYSHSIGNTPDPTAFGDMASQRATSYSAKIGAGWQTPFGLITNTNYYNHDLAKSYEATDGGKPYGFETDLFVSQLQDQFKIGSDHTFRAGLEYRFLNFRNTGAFLVPESPDTKENNYALSASWMWQITDKLSWTNAGRFDHRDMAEVGTLLPGSFYTYADYSHAINAFSANSDLVYRPNELDSFRLGYGRGIQMPSIMVTGQNILMNFAGSDADYEGAPRLKPTVVQDYSFDYTRKVSQIGSFVKVMPFYELNQDIAIPYTFAGNETINGNTYPVYVTQNGGNSSAWGLELQLKGSHPSGFRWDTSYSFSRVTDSQGILSGVDYQGSAPQHHFRLLLGYTTGKWEFDANGQYLTGTNILRSTDGGATQSPLGTDPYATLSGRIGYKINEAVTVAVSGTNLAQSTTHESPYPAVKRQVFLGLTGKF